MGGGVGAKPRVATPPAGRAGLRAAGSAYACTDSAPVTPLTSVPPVPLHLDVVSEHLRGRAAPAPLDLGECFLQPVPGPICPPSQPLPDLASVPNLIDAGQCIDA